MTDSQCILFFLSVRTDTTLPVGGYLNAGSNSGISQLYSSSLTTVSANWGGFYDHESDISHYIVDIDIQQPNSVTYDRVHSELIESNYQSFTWGFFSLNNGANVRIMLTVVNGAGSSRHLSVEYIIDLTPPELEYIVDGLNRSQDLDYQSDPNTISAMWSVNDSQSSIARIEVSVFELREGRRSLVYPNQSLTDEISVVIPNDSVTWHSDSLSLKSGSRYSVSIRFINGAGLKVEYETNGVILDTTPPIAHSVTVLGDTPGSYEASDSATVIGNPNLIEVYWSASDLESGVQEYIVGVVDENSTFVTMMGENYISFGSATGGILENMNLVSGNEYRIVVVAKNFAGLLSDPTFSDLFR